MKTHFLKLMLFAFTVFFASCSNTRSNDNNNNAELTSVHTLEGLPLIGSFNGMDIYEGGISGMYYIPDTDMEFYLINDRGPNMDMTNHPLAEGINVKVFPFPDYAPKIFRAKLEDGKFFIEEVITIKNPDGLPVSGLPFPGSSDDHQEIAWHDLEGSVAGPDIWGIDAEGIALGHNNDFWIVEEYRTSVINIDRETGNIKAIYGPELINEYYQPIDSVFKYRRPNRGFESVAVSPSGKVFAMLQSVMWNPSAEVSNNSRLIRLLELNPKTGETQIYLYEHADAHENIRLRDWKIADMVAVNDHEFLVLEHATRNGQSKMDVYKIDIKQATPLTDEYYNGLTPEQLNNKETASKHGIKTVRKKHIIDMLDAGYDQFYDKPEGLAIIDKNTIAIINDNDYDIDAPNKDAEVIKPGMQTKLFIFELPDAIN